MGTYIGTQKTLGDMLNSLIELNYDGISAYESALTRVKREDYRVRLRAMAADLRRHLDELKPHVEALTTNVSDSPSPKELLTKGRVLAASLVGDALILRALRRNQQDVQEALEAAVAFDGNTKETKTMLEGHLRTETGHSHWLDSHVETPAKPQAADEVEATMKQRTIARTDALNKTPASSTDI